MPRREGESVKEYNARKQREWRAKNRDRSRQNDRRNDQKRRRNGRAVTSVYFGPKRLADVTRAQMKNGYDNLSSLVCDAVDLTAGLTAKEIEAFKLACRQVGKEPAEVLKELVRGR